MPTESILAWTKESRPYQMAQTRLREELGVGQRLGQIAPFVLLSQPEPRSVNGTPQAVASQPDLFLASAISLNDTPLCVREKMRPPDLVFRVIGKAGTYVVAFETGIIKRGRDGIWIVETDCSGGPERTFLPDGVSQGWLNLKSVPGAQDGSFDKAASAVFPIPGGGRTQIRVWEFPDKAVMVEFLCRRIIGEERYRFGSGRAGL